MILRVVFFDAAGTLFAPREPVGESYAALARRFGVDAGAAAVDVAFRRAFHASPALAFGPGHSASELRQLGRQWWREVVSATFAGLGTFSDFDSYFTALFDFFADPAHWVPDPAAAPLLSHLKGRGLGLGIISNFDHRLYGILDELGLATYFDSVTISSEAGYAKPSPKLFAAALGKHLAAASESLHVGDSENLDMHGAAALGMAAALLDRGRELPDEVIGRYAWVASLASVPEVVEILRCY
jgi:putative hydrolase of the HAD superfamily